MRRQHVQQVHFVDMGIGMRGPHPVGLEQVFPLLTGIVHADAPDRAPAALTLNPGHLSAQIRFRPLGNAVELVGAF